MKTEIIPVIHMTSEAQVMTNIQTCVECGIKKVFIINHVVKVDELMLCAIKVAIKYPLLWVGINPLGVPAEKALSMPIPSIIQGVWCDETISIPRNRVRTFKGMVFGGVAFKYQPQPADLKQACEEAKTQTSVATTSGAGTGQPATISKIKAMREYLGEHPLAIASGVSIDNIDNYKGLANYLLVATSIIDDDEMIIKEKLSELKSKL